VFALGRESASFLRLFPPQQRFPGAPCRARFCGPAWLTVLVLETGVGPARAAAAAEWLLGQPVLENVPYRPKVVIAAGFAGALQERWKVGDIILATEVVDLAGNVWPTTWPTTLPGGEWQPPLHRQRVLTRGELVATPEEKRALGEKFEAAVVDMESAVIAEACRRRGVPFGCVRAVSDDWQTPLPPELVACLAGGQVAPWRLLKTVAKSPRRIGELWRLAKQTRHAGDQLSKALGELLTLTLPWSSDL
jgi:adenosylhomocysteine nucleosidase